MKSFLRFLMRNRLYSLINFAGLTLSLALVTIIFGYAGAQRKISRSTPDYKNTYALAWAATPCSATEFRTAWPDFPRPKR